MRTRFLPLGALLLNIHAQAQLTAGEVPNGLNALDLNIHLALTTSFTTDSAGLELDCDDFPDAWAVLHRGFPAVDAPNSAMLHFVDSDMEVCLNMAPGFQQRPKYHAFGEPLDCAGDFDWQSGAQLVLGDLGGFTAIGPASIDSLYIAYRRGPALGWIQLSFDVIDDAVIDLQVHRVLPLCPGAMSVARSEEPVAVLLFPNPSNGEGIRLQGTETMQSIEVLDPRGRIIARYSGTERTIPAPTTAGLYLVRVTFADGRRATVRFVRD